MEDEPLGPLGFPPKFQTIMHEDQDTLGVIVILLYMAAVDWAVKSSSKAQVRTLL